MNAWQTIITAVGGSAALSLSLTYLLKEWISTRIRNSIAHEYDVELEGFKAGYRKVLDENQIRFSKLYVDQAEALKTLYRHLAAEHSVLLKLTAMFKQGSKDEIAERDASLRKQFVERHNEGLDFFRHNRLLIPKGICDEVDAFLHEAKGAFVNYTTYDGLELCDDTVREMHKIKNETSERVRGHLEEALHRSEAAFRHILGVSMGEITDAE